MQKKWPQSSLWNVMNFGKRTTKCKLSICVSNVVDNTGQESVQPMDNNVPFATSNHFAKICRSKLKHKSQCSEKKVDVVKDKDLGSNQSDSDVEVFSLDPIKIHGLAEH